MSQERSQRLAQFVDWSTHHITGDEKGQAQIFLDRLFQAFGQRGSLDVGGTPEFRIHPGRDDTGGTSFADYVWKPIVLIEMKKRGQDLAKHRQQAFDYWIKLVPNRPQYTVLCNFDEFWIYDFNIDLDDPLDTVKLADLPQRYEPLAFLFPTAEKPIFQNNRVEVTKKAADRLATVFFHMTHVRHVDRQLAQRFTLQMLVALFAEDIDLLPKNFVTNLLADIKTPEDSYDLLGNLFEAMNRPGGTPAGRFKGVRYFNGGLFKDPARLALDDCGIELAHLRQAAAENWAKVSPDIFGTLFQHSMDAGERHAFGAHYTAPMDIMKIVRPTIVEPWTHLINSAKKPKQLADLLERISMYTVLDPACGSGNFLYIAYRELKRLETRIRDRLRSEFPDFQATLHHVTARQFRGLDIIPFAIELAKVTMMIARKLAIDELHIADEPPLPLDNLDANFQCTDALLTPAASSSPAQTPLNVGSSTLNVGRSTTSDNGPMTQSSDGPLPTSIKTQNSKIDNPLLTSWPSADVIIGNPPFLGSRFLPKERGYEYQRALHALYPDMPKMADYCVYWFRRAHDHLPVCTPDRPESGRAGLVGTQNIRNNQSRVGGLDHIAQSGTIVEAVDNQPWSGEANVHVSIANWVKTANSTRSVSEGESSPVPSQIENHKSKIENPPDPAKLLIPATKKLWFKADPKRANANSASKSIVTTTGTRGKTLASKSYELDFRQTPNISASLSDQTSSTAAALINAGFTKTCYVGQYPFNDGFLLSPQEARDILDRAPQTRDVLFPYLLGRDLVADGKTSQWIIDFGRRDMLQARAYSAVFERVQRIVMPIVLSKAEKEKAATGKESTRWTRLAEHWWQLRDPQPGTMAAIAAIPRYVACSRVTKRPIFAFVSRDIHPDNTVMVFAFPDDYSFGILQSAAHWLWFITKCSKLKSDFRYTAESVFDTFPWPQSPTKKQIAAVAAAGREIRRIRTAALEKIPGGLRALYRTLDLPGQNPLKDAHAALDSAVLAAYNFTPKADLLTQLLTLNLDVATRIQAGTPVTAPGVPAIYGTPKPLISDDCITP